MRLWKFIVVSVLGHLLFSGVFEALSQRSADGPRIRREAVRVRIVREPKKASAVPQEAVAKKPMKRSPPTSIQPSTSGTPQRERRGAVQYSDLLPKNFEDVGEPSSGIGEDSAGADGPRLAEFGSMAVRASDEIKLNLDIPLVFRQNQTEGHAFAKIRQGPGPGKLTLVFLDGDPHFRAVLYDLLVRQKLKWGELLVALHQRELAIALRFEVKQQPNPQVWDQTDVFLEGRKLVIQRTRFVWQAMDGSLPQKGIPLPDEYAERAIMHDKSHLQKLRQSPAYMSPLRDADF